MCFLYFRITSPQSLTKIHKCWAQKRNPKGSIVVLSAFASMQCLPQKYQTKHALYLKEIFNGFEDDNLTICLIYHITTKCRLCFTFHRT